MPTIIRLSRLANCWTLWVSNPAGKKFSTRVQIGPGAQPGKYELRSAVKKLYQLRPEVSASRVSVASRVVNPKHEEMRPAVSKELYQLRRNIWVYKMSNNQEVLTQFYCTLLYTQLYGHTQNC